MEQSQAQRRLVKSPPELWAQVSSEDALRRHLAEFGEIRITRVEPETTVAWEGDRASGTVQISPTGWGTQVTLTAEPVAAEPETAEPAPAAEPEPVITEPEASEPVADPVPTPVARISLREAEPPEHPAPELDPAPRGFFARFFRRPTAPLTAPSQPLAVKPLVPGAAIPAPPAPTPDPSPPTPGPDPLPPVPGPAPTPPPMPDPGPPGPGPPGPGPGPTIQRPLEPLAPATAEPTSEPAPLALDPERTVAVLTGVLDVLGAAHHRPFTRG